MGQSLASGFSPMETLCDFAKEMGQSLVSDFWRNFGVDPQYADPRNKCDQALIWMIWVPLPLLVLSLAECAGVWMASTLAVFLFSWVTTIAALFFRLLGYATCILVVVAVIRVAAYGHLSVPVIVPCTLKKTTSSSCEAPTHLRGVCGNLLHRR